MKLGRWVLVLVAMLAVSVAAVSAAEKSDKKGGSDVNSKLEAMERTTWEAVKNRDLEAFYGVVDKEAYATDVMGLSAASQMAEMMKDFELRDYELASFKTLKAGNDVYVLTYTAKQDCSFKGQPLPREVYASTVYAKRGNKWLAVFHQETPSMSAMGQGGHEGHGH